MSPSDHKEHFTPAAMPRADQDLQALRDNQVPPTCRDTCAHLLIPLNKCRREEYFMPWKCGNERHLYEECEYIAWRARVDTKAAKMAADEAAAKAAAAAAQD
jgi:NADH dehydrogenase (ubiquinone) 1 beta subcomplex subunit 7